MDPEYTFIELHEELLLQDSNINIKIMLDGTDTIALCGNGFAIILRSDGTYSSGPDGEG